VTSVALRFYRVELEWLNVSHPSACAQKRIDGTGTG
jgi:hypothetical protein